MGVKFSTNHKILILLLNPGLVLVLRMLALLISMNLSGSGAVICCALWFPRRLRRGFQTPGLRGEGPTDVYSAYAYICMHHMHDACDMCNINSNSLELTAPVRYLRVLRSRRVASSTQGAEFIATAPFAVGRIRFLPRFCGAPQCSFCFV